MRSRLIQTDVELSKLTSAWDKLVPQSPFPNVFSTFGYSAAWWAVHSASHLLRVVVVETSTSVRLIAPLCATKTDPYHWFPLGRDGADYTMILFAKGDDEALCEFWKFLTNSNEWSRITIPEIPFPESLKYPKAQIERNAPKTKALENMIAGQFPIAIVTRKLNHPHMSRAEIEAQADLLAKKNYKKHVNWLSRQGKLEYECLKDTASILKALDEFIELHRKKWSEKGSPSFYESSDERLFGRKIVEEMGNKMRMDRLRLGGKTIAAHLGFEWEGRLYWYLTSYDPTYHSHSPGKILLAHVFAEVAEKKKVQEIDFLRGREAYKDHYAQYCRETADVNLFRTRLSLFKTIIERKVLKAA